MKSHWQKSIAATLFLASIPLFAQDTPPKPPAPPQVQQIAPGLFQVGTVRLDKNKQTLSFPAHFHITEGLIEYLVVTTAGKLHESLLRTEAQPQHVQVSMLLLGAKAAPADQIQQLLEKPNLAIPGAPVEIELRWKAGGKERSVRIEELVLNKKTKGPMPKGSFVFNGSRVFEGTFIAQRDGSIVSLITDADAQFNNPHPGREDDENFTIAKDKVPPKDTAVEVLIRLVKPVEKPSEKPAAK
ncbi:MAG: hypothetical protein EXS29_01845 [Pedosphaera sp.]|nr:hypothetical protein [Pedosphaera sp.]MST00041.1 hypothetical protein [Pedosphaera sp.]